MTRHDSLTSDLCNEIDFLEARLKQVEEERDEFRLKYNALLDDSIKDCQRTTGALVMLALKGALKLPASNEPR